MPASTVFTSYQVQFKDTHRDKNWSIWHTDKDFEKIKKMKTSFGRTKAQARILEIRTVITVLEE